MPRPVSDGASEIRPPPGARRLLVWSTQAAIPWAIATSSRMETAAVNLAALDVDPVQIPVITRDQVRYAKPDPDWLQNLDDELMYLIGSMKELNCPVYLCRLNRSTQHRR
jgi:phosphoglycolate phosphatase-like HAD superfamily hydrolase